MFRLLALFVVLAVVVAPSFVMAEEKKVEEKKKEATHEGTIKSVDSKDNKLTLAGKEKDHVCEVAKDAKITCGGKECKLSDLKPGFKVKFTMTNKKVTKIEATPPAKK